MIMMKEIVMKEILMTMIDNHIIAHTDSNCIYSVHDKNFHCL